MVERVTQVVPGVLHPELMRLGRNWLRVESVGETEFKLHVPRSYLETFCSRSNDWLSLYAAGAWLLDGPKVFRPTPEQCEALVQVEVRLQLEDYQQPFPVLLVELPVGGKYTSVMCHLHQGILVLCCISGDRKDDVTTVVKPGKPIEMALQKFDDECAPLATECARVTRVAVNSCLCLVDQGYLRRYLLPHEVERDRKLAKEASERGRRAKERKHLELLELDRTVVLHTSEGGEHGTGGSGEKCAHWRRGCWVMQPCGPGHSLRRRTFRRPVLVRADRAMGTISTEYRT